MKKAIDPTNEVLKSTKISSSTTREAELRDALERMVECATTISDWSGWEPVGNSLWVKDHEAEDLRLAIEASREVLKGVGR